jgi:N-acetylglucosaminyl-diphospho-decaprenol L-rhamnosyltransferase
MVERVVSTLLGFPEVKQVVVTCNIPERLALGNDPRISVINNAGAKGFGTNHNAAFLLCAQPVFCVLNPDVEFQGNPFPGLLEVVGRNDVSVAAPLVRGPGGGVEDSARYFPTVLSFAKKLLAGSEGRHLAEGGQVIYYPEWIAGMFMLFRSEDFRRLGGFDEAFFLYYEDVDICVRAWKHNMRVAVCTQVEIVHDARRDSRRSLRHLRWHMASLARYFWKHWGRLPRVA